MSQIKIIFASKHRKNEDKSIYKDPNERSRAHEYHNGRMLCLVSYPQHSEKHAERSAENSAQAKSALSDALTSGAFCGRFVINAKHYSQC